MNPERFSTPIQNIWEFIEPQIDEVGDDVGYVPVGVHKYLLAVIMGNIYIIPVKGFEELDPQVGTDEKGMLCSPVIHVPECIIICSGPLGE